MATIRLMRRPGRVRADADGLTCAAFADVEDGLAQARGEGRLGHLVRGDDRQPVGVEPITGPGCLPTGVHQGTPGPATFAHSGHGRYVFGGDMADDLGMSDWDEPRDWDGDSDRAPICGSCGVTALPGELANVIDSHFVCDNPDCDAYGEAV